MIASITKTLCEYDSKLRACEKARKRTAMPSDRKMATGILIASRALMNRQTLE